MKSPNKRVTYIGSNIEEKIGTNQRNTQTERDRQLENNEDRHKSHRNRDRQGDADAGAAKEQKNKTINMADRQYGLHVGQDVFGLGGTNHNH